MKTFVSSIFLMLAAFASARTFESYEQHVASIEEGVEEMPLFEFVDKGDGGGGKGGGGGSKPKKSGGDSKKKESKKKSDGGKDDDKKKSNGKNKSSRSSDGKNKSSRSSSSSRSSKRKSSSSSSSSGSRKTYDRSTYTDDMCCDASKSDKDTCDTLWDTVCAPPKPLTDAQKTICDHVGFDKPECIPTEDVRTSLRGNIAAE